MTIPANLAEWLPIAQGERSVLLVCHQHLLPSVIPLFSFMRENIADPHDTWVIGKPYSSIPETEDALRSSGLRVIESEATYLRGHYSESIRRDMATVWRRFEASLSPREDRRIVIVDEGGYLAETIPEHLLSRAVAVEQTAFGTRSASSRLPTVEVALCRAKRHFESPSIARAVTARLAELVPNLPNETIGVVGLGALGRSVASRCCDEGMRVWGFDPWQPGIRSASNIVVASTLAELLAEVTIVIGCAGFDSIPNAELPRHPLVLASASSADVEFNGLLRGLSSHGEPLLATLRGPNPHGPNHTILNGGFPINFDCRTEREPAANMMLTRALMAAGIVQATALPRATPPGRVSLQADWQRDIVKAWARSTGIVPLEEIPEPLDWWAADGRVAA